MGEDIDGKEEDEDSVTTELMTVGLKILRKEDVTWLLSLPQLKNPSLHAMKPEPIQRATDNDWAAPSRV